MLRCVWLALVLLSWAGVARAQDAQPSSVEASLEEAKTRLAALKS